MVAVEVVFLDLLDSRLGLFLSLLIFEILALGLRLLRNVQRIIQQILLWHLFLALVTIILPSRDVQVLLLPLLTRLVISLTIILWLTTLWVVPVLVVEWVEVIGLLVLLRVLLWVLRLQRLVRILLLLLLLGTLEVIDISH